MRRNDHRPPECPPRPTDAPDSPVEHDGVVQATRARLDGLAADDDHVAILHEVCLRAGSDPEKACEILSVIDQFYRRGKIRQEAYQWANAHLSGILVRGPRGTIGSRAPPPMQARPAAQVTVPVRAAAPAPAVESAAAPRSPAPGDLLGGRYRITGVVGQGGMGTVFEAVDEHLAEAPESDRRVALKVLHTDVSRRPDLLNELHAEFRHLQSLSHPNIVRVHDFACDGALAFFTMDLLDGASLDEVLSARAGAPLKRAHAFAVIRAVGAALAHAHSHGLVHGDVNPRNIVHTRGGEWRVLDFGAARRMGSAGPGATPAATLGYSSCEVLEGRPPDVRDDLFSLACVAYLLLSGRHPFGTLTALQARSARVRPARPAGLGRRQWLALRSGLDARHEGRPADVASWVRQLTQPARRGRTALAASLAAAMLVAAGLWALQLGHRPRQFTVAAPPGPDPTLDAVRSVPHAQTPARPPAAGRPAPGGGAVAARPAQAKESPLARPVAGAARPLVELASSVVEIARGSAFAQVVVLRRGDPSGAVHFAWWTESGTAKPGRDFVGFSARPAQIAPGARSLTLLIPIVFDSTRREPRNFYVQIDDPGPGARLGARTIAMVSIPPSD